MCELVLSLNDASARFPGGVRPLDEDPALSFLPTIDAGVGSNPGGEFDAPENDAFLLTSGIELNDRSAASPDARPLDRRLGASSPFCVTSEFRFAFPRVARPLDVDDFPCARTFASIATHLIRRVVERGHDASCFGDFVEVTFCFPVVPPRARRETSRRRDVSPSDARGRERRRACDAMDYNSDVHVRRCTVDARY